MTDYYAATEKLDLKNIQVQAEMLTTWLFKTESKLYIAFPGYVQNPRTLEYQKEGRESDTCVRRAVRERPAQNCF